MAPPNSRLARPGDIFECRTAGCPREGIRMEVTPAVKEPLASEIYIQCPQCHEAPDLLWRPPRDERMAWIAEEAVAEARQTPVTPTDPEQDRLRAEVEQLRKTLIERTYEAIVDRVLETTTIHWGPSLEAMERAHADADLLDDIRRRRCPVFNRGGYWACCWCGVPVYPAGPTANHDPNCLWLRIEARGERS